jgi:hypothetical protein
MTRLLALVLALMGSSLALSAPPKLPAAGTVKCAPGQITSVEIESDGAEKEIAWARGFSPESVYVDEGKPLRKGTARLIVSPKKAGVYYVILWTVGEREYSTLIIDAGPAVPDPVIPPAPVIPPGPVVPPQPELDSFTKAVVAAYKADPAADKRERAVQLAAVMQKAAKYANDPAVASNVVLVAKVSKDTTAAVGDSLPKVRDAIGDYLASKITTDPINLTPELRAAFEAAYTKAAEAVALAPSVP